MDLGSGYDLWESGSIDEVDLGCGYGVWESSQVYSMMEDKDNVGHLVSTNVSISISVS